MTDQQGEAGGAAATSPRQRVGRLARRRRRRILIIAAGSILTILLVAAVLAPSIASSVAPGLVGDAISGSIAGKVTVARVSLSWFGAQRAGPVIIQDETGLTIAKFSVETSRGLFGLLRGGLGLGPLDLGRVKVSGEATIVRSRDGETNIARLFETDSNGTGGGRGGGGKGQGGADPHRLPGGLSMDLVVESLDVRFIDEGGEGPRREVDLRGATAAATFANGTVTLALNAPAFAIESGTEPQPAGMLKVDVRVTQLTDASGLFTPEAAVIDATIDATDLSTAIAGVLTGVGSTLSDGLGKTVGVSVRAKGGLAEGEATITVASAGLNADVGLRSAGGMVKQSRPGSISITGPALAAIIPDEPIRRAGVTIQTFPSVELTLDAVRFPIPSGGKPLDLRSAGMIVAVRSSAASGTVSIPDQPARLVALAPVVATIDARSLASGATIKAQTSVTLDGAAAGSIGVDLAATNIIDGDGAFRSVIPPVSGQAVLSNLSTAAAQPLVAAYKLDLPAGVGPTVDLVLTASPVPDSHRTDIDLKIKSAGVNGSATARIDGSIITSHGEFSLKSPNALVGNALGAQGVQLSAGGFAKAVVRSITLDSARALDSAAADIDISFGGFSIAPADTAAAPIELKQVLCTAKVAPGQAPAVSFSGSGSHSGAECSAQGELRIPGLLVSSAGGPMRVDVSKLRPIGNIQINNVPVSLVEFTSKRATEGGPDLTKVLRDAFGPSVTISVNATAQPGAPEGRDIEITASADRLSGGIRASIDDAAISLAKFDFRTAVTPELAAALLDLVGPAQESKPTLSGPAAVVVSATPFTIPMKGLEPQLARAGDVEFKIGLDGKTHIGNIALRDRNGQRRDVGVTALEDILIRGRFPLSALASGSPAKPAEATLTGLILGERDERIAEVNGSAKSDFAGGRPVGDLLASLAIAVQNTARLDAILGKSGLMSGAVGESLNITSAAVITFPGNGSPSMAGFEHASLDLSISSPRVETAQSLKASATPHRFAVDGPMVLTWKPDAAWINQYVLGSHGAGAPADPTALRVTGLPVLTVRLLKLVLPAGETPMKPGVFLADVELNSPEVTLAAGEASSTIKGFAARVMGGHEPGVIGFSIRAEDLGSGGGPAGEPALLAKGGLYHVADAEGRPTLDAAVLSMSADAYSAPTAILDAMEHQGGMLAETLGSVVTLNVRTEGANSERGLIVGKATSPRAEFEIRGVMTRGLFISEGEPEIVLRSITPELGRMLVKGLPLIGTFEKKPEDGPALVRAKGLAVPTDGLVQKFNGDFRIELGQVRFETSTVFGSLVRLAQQREAGKIGRRLDPLTLSVKDGVITYPRYKLPLGNFTVDTRGTVDLVNRRMEVFTYIPFGALSDEAAGKLSTGLGRLIGGAIPLIEQATMIPFRTAGSFADPKTELDLELFVKEAGRTILRPDLLIKDRLDKLFKKEEKK